MELTDLGDAARHFRDAIPSIVYPSSEEAARINRLRIEQNVAFFQANPEGLADRLAELETEWDVGYVLQLVTGGLSIAGCWLSLSRGRLWLLLPLLSAVAQLQHTVAGRGPVADFARRMGFRTRDEIESEIIALQAIRGDFAGASRPA